MPFVESTPSLHFPRICTMNILPHVLYGGRKVAILDNKDLHATGEEIDFDIDGKLIKVNKDLVEFAGINEEWLRTPIQGKFVYIPVNGGASWLPLSTPGAIKVRDQEDPSLGALPSSQGLNFKSWGYSYAPVILHDEKNLADLVCNAYMYMYDPYECAFVRHSNPDWNAIKGVIRRFLITLSGGTDERVADYGRIILFLLSKVELTEEEKAALAPLLPYTPTVDSLSDVVRREAFIQRFVAEAKRNPQGFLQWGANWSKFWWETSN